MINLGPNWDLIHWPDEWTATTVDGKRSAQFEETLLCVDCRYYTGNILTSFTGSPKPVSRFSLQGRAARTCTTTKGFHINVRLRCTVRDSLHCVCTISVDRIRETFSDTFLL